MSWLSDRTGINIDTRGNYKSTISADEGNIDNDPFRSHRVDVWDTTGRANDRQQQLNEKLGQGTSTELLAHTDIESSLGEQGLGYLTSAAQYFNNLRQISSSDRVRSRLFNIIHSGGSTAGLNPEIAQQQLNKQGKPNET